MKKKPKCVCKGNWRIIISECQDLLGRKYKNDKGQEYRFFGVVHGSDDYYYGMWNLRTHETRLLSCVGWIEDFGFELIPDEGTSKEILT